jgi:hypothetical protein
VILRTHDLADDRWDAWHPAEAARLLEGVAAPWYVAAGWAIDLFLGGQRREHGDLEIAVPADRFAEVAHALAAFELFVPGKDEAGRETAWPYASAGEQLKTHHQTWVREPATGLWRLDVFREPSDGDTWICRRDERIRLPYGSVVLRTDEGIPYARPEIVLLFKAKHAHQAKDENDFTDVLPRLDQPRRRWLAQAIALAHPGHPWIARIGELTTPTERIGPAYGT